MLNFEVKELVDAVNFSYMPRHDWIASYMSREENKEIKANIQIYFLIYM